MIIIISHTTSRTRSTCSYCSRWHISLKRNHHWGRNRHRWSRHRHIIIIGRDSITTQWLKINLRIRISIFIIISLIFRLLMFFRVKFTLIQFLGIFTIQLTKHHNISLMCGIRRGTRSLVRFRRLKKAQRLFFLIFILIHL